MPLKPQGQTMLFSIVDIVHFYTKRAEELNVMVFGMTHPRQLG